MTDLTRDERIAIVDYFATHFPEYYPWGSEDVFASIIAKLDVRARMGKKPHGGRGVVTEEGSYWETTIYQ